MQATKSRRTKSKTSKRGKYHTSCYADKLKVIDGIISAITNESPYYPLPDSEIASMITESGVAISGANVGYYRRMLGFGGAPQRRKPLAEVKGE